MSGQNEDFSQCCGAGPFFPGSGSRFFFGSGFTYNISAPTSSGSEKQMVKVCRHKEASINLRCSLKNEKRRKNRVNIFKSFRFSLAKQRSRSRPKLSVPAPDKILNRFRLQLKNLGSDRLRLRNTNFSITTYLPVINHLQKNYMDPKPMNVIHSNKSKNAEILKFKTKL